jgi:hypothetical protein
MTMRILFLLVIKGQAKRHVTASYIFNVENREW